jgi:hypothetical protein
MSTWSARQKLKQSSARVLIDNSVLGFGVTHETVWISTGTKKWGGVHDVETGYSARVPVHAPDNESQEYANIKYLAGIAALARKGAIELLTSAELTDERIRQPVGRFRGYGWFDYSIFNDIRIASIDGHRLPAIGPTGMNLPTAKEQQQARIAQANDRLYLALVNLLGQKHNLDAWHIRTAEVNGLFCFLTMDFKLRNHVEANKRHEPIRSLTTKIMTPMEFGQEFGLMPISPQILSYHNASFFVRPDLNMPNSRRRPLSAYRKNRDKENKSN